MKLSQFREFVYLEGSAPSMRTLRARINDIPGGRIELGRYWVDIDEYDRVTHLRNRLAAQQEELAQHPLLKGLI